MNSITTTAAHPSLGQSLGVVLASLRMRLITASRYPGQLIVDLVLPLVLTAIPILVGRAQVGEQAAQNFLKSAGTTNYTAYMLIGACTFMFVSNAFWHIAYWLRWEQETGTIEALYLTPANRLLLAAGVSLYSLIRSMIVVFVAFVSGSLIFSINPLQGSVLLAIAALLSGMPALFGMTLLFGAAVLKFKQANALISLMQWLISMLMGVFFPVAILPPLIRAIALLLPTTWMLNSARSELLGIDAFFTQWYIDLAIIWVFSIVTPLLGSWLFLATERRLRSSDGLGQF